MKMASKNFDDSDGVWRTIGGRKVFIRKGQSLSDAMKESGKFKKSNVNDTNDKNDVDNHKTKFNDAMDLPTRLSENAELAEKIIADEEYNDIAVKTYTGDNVWVENERTGKKFKLGPNDTKETIETGIKETLNDEESISDLYDVKETEDGYEGKGKELLKFIENEEQDSGVEISDALKDKLRKNPDDTFVFDNENETIVAKRKNNPYARNNEGGSDDNSSKFAQEAIDHWNKKNEEYKAQYGKDDEMAKSFVERWEKEKASRLKGESKEVNKDGKYYRNRLQELDSADTPTGTYDIETGEIVDFKGKGYNVSFEQTGVQLSDDEYLAKINECRDRCDGKVYFGKYGGTPEVSFYTEDINEAMKIMKENNQYSIYDIANDTEIFNDEYDASTNKIKDLSQTKTNDILPNKEDIIKEYNNYSKDIGKRVSKDKFASEYTKNLYDNGKIGLNDFEQTQKNIKDNLKDIKSTNETMNEKIRTSVSKDKKIPRNLSKDIYELDVDKGNAWSGNATTKNANGDEFVRVRRNGPSQNSSQDIKDAIEKKYPHLEGKIVGDNEVDFSVRKNDTTNDTMNKAIREKASKKSTFKDDLPKRTEIKTQGTSNRKEVSENIQAHILEHYDSPQDFIEQMDVFDNMPTKWHAGQEMAKQGFYDIYYEDQRKFLNDLKINPNGKEFSDDKVFQTYTSLIGRESAKLYDRLMKNEYNKYKQSHPLAKMTLEEFIKSRKEK